MTLHATTLSPTIITSSLLAGYLLLASACFDAPPPATDEMAQAESELVFGEYRDVEQARGQWRHAEAVDPQDELRRFQLIQTALASRGTASIWGRVLDPKAIPPCNDHSETTTDGSGLLSSSTRLVTARHVVAGIYGDIEVYFESTRPAFYPFDSGRFIADADSSGHPLVNYDRPYPYQTKFDSEEENPLLANRLAQLGMEELDENREESRDKLRGPWIFDIEREVFPAHFHPNRELDIAVLETEWVKSDLTANAVAGSLNHLESGSFPMVPGIFFDYRPFQISQHLVCPEPLGPGGVCPVDLVPTKVLWPASLNNPAGERVSDLWLLHHNYFPGDPQEPVHPEPQSTNLISNPFPYISTGKQNGLEKGFRHTEFIETADYRYCRGVDDLHTLQFGDLFEVALDAFRGSSGGALLQARRSTRPTEFRYRLQPSAIQSGIFPDGQPLTEWGLPIGANELTNHALQFTAVNAVIWGTSKRDGPPEDPLDPYDPSDPEPLQPDENEAPPCAKIDPVTRECLLYETSSVENDAFTDVPDDLEPFQWPDDANDDDTEDLDARSEAANVDQYRLVTCGNSHPPFATNLNINTGLAVGFFGSLGYDPDYRGRDMVGEGSVVGYLRMICAPWSPAPFVANWPFLRHIGVSWTRTERDTKAVSPAFARLWAHRSLADTLSNFAEYRHILDDSGETIDRYLRPVSMKTCPPNYFLKGFEFQTRRHPQQSQNKRVVTGITVLICSLSSSSPAGERLDEELRRPLYLSEDEDDPCPFSMGGRCFSRSQYIGWTQPRILPTCNSAQSPNGCIEETTCPGGEVAVGFAYRRDPDGFITGIRLECIEEP